MSAPLNLDPGSPLPPLADLLAECKRQRAEIARLRGALERAAAGFAVASNQMGATHPGLADADNLNLVRSFCMENFLAARAALGEGQG